MSRILAQIVAPTTFLASVLMYLGTIRLNAMYSKLGVNTSMLSFTFQESVMSSVKVADEPLVLFLLALLMVILLAPFVHEWLFRSTAWHRTATIRALRVLIVLGSASLVVALAAMADWPECWHPPVFVKPLFLVLGTILLVSSFYLKTTLKSGPVVSTTARIVQRTVLAALLLVPVLWFVDEHAREVGGREAEKILAHPEQTLVTVVVYAAQRLNLDGPGIKEKALTDPNAGFRYQYTGLRLLIQSNRQYFLVPVCWGATTPGARAIVLPADGSIRLETLNVKTKPSCPKGH
ncbi:hypothetical protein ACIBI9_39695 [Nonomuraea sp. NPDC050451]|uniref:hypothetical protein n=1 Tax=Nonomuraea sp. NPDC050451 TaxID=3364364 RepID=UPI0037ACC910